MATSVAAAAPAAAEAPRTGTRRTRPRTATQPGPPAGGYGRPLVWRTAYLAGLVLLTIGIFVTYRVRPFNSDDVAQQTIVDQWARGYHHVARVGADNFVLKIPLYFLMGKLMPNGRPALLATDLVLNLVGFSLFFLSVRYFARKLTGGSDAGSDGGGSDSGGSDSRGGHDTTSWVLPVVWLSSLGLGLLNAMLNPNVRNVEIGMAFFVLMEVAKLWDGERTLTPAYGVVAVAGLGIYLYNDPYFLFLLVVPVAAFLVVTLLADRARDRRRTASLVALLAAAVAGSKAWNVVFAHAGFHAESNGAQLASAGQLWPHVRLLWEGIVHLFQLDGFSRTDLTLASVHAVVGPAPALCLFAYPFLLRRRHLTQSPWRWFFALYPFLLAAVFVAGTQAVDLGSYRYLVLIPFVTVLVFGMTAHAARAGWLRRALVALGAAAIGVNVVSTLWLYRHLPTGANADNLAVVDAVRASGITKGYAAYWAADINTYLADDRADVVPVRCRYDSLRFYHWLTDDAILRKPTARSFYLFEPGNRWTCGHDAVVRQFGPPAQELAVDGVTSLMVYDYDIGSRL